MDFSKVDDGGETSKERLLKISVFTIMLTMTIIAIVFETHIFSEESIFNKDVSSNNSLNWMYRNIPNIFTTCQIVFVSMVVYLIARRVFGRSSSKNSSGRTAAMMFLSFTKYLIAVLALMSILSIWGVNTTTIVASAGVVSLVIGLGAQSLIADILAGMFIVFEQEYKVGDVVTIDGWRGTVTEIGIRCTKIVDIGGDTLIVNNSSVKSIVNQSRGLSVAKAEVGIDYSESLPRVELILRDNLDRMRRNIPYIVDGPYYKGVSRLGDSSVNLLVYAGCEEDDVLDVERCMNREIKMIFEENDISIPFPQIVMNRPSPMHGRDEVYRESEALEFLRKQLEDSKGLEEED